MKKIGFCFVLLSLSWVLKAQNDSFPAVFSVFPEKGEAYAPVLSPFCLNHGWLGEREFDLLSRRFVSSDSASCIPKSAQRLWHGASVSDLNPTRLWWKADPYDPNLFWTKDYREDDSVPWQDRVQTLIVWRYNRETAKQDSFVSLVSGDFTIGKPGIWVTNSKELLLLDRRSGDVILKAENPFGLGRGMSLQPWGDNLIVSDQWLYQVKQHQYVPFFPLPAEMEGCKSPEKVEFQAELCLSMVRSEGSQYSYHILAPGYPPTQVPFEPVNFSYQNRLLAVNPPLAWLCKKDTLIGFDYTTGALEGYPGSSDTPLHGNHEGRYLGFYAELGLSFFDKYTCQFRVLQLPFGHKMPRNFATDGQYIFLTYEDHWEIINFSKLASVFRPSSILAEYSAFEQEWQAWAKDANHDFYKNYEVYLSIYYKYKDFKNPKIAGVQHQFASWVSYQLMVTPDSVLSQVASDYSSSRFDPSISCEIALGLFKWYGQKGDLEAARSLLPMLENEPCINQILLDDDWRLQNVKVTNFKLDSVAQLNLAPDENLFATGKVWFDYCLTKRWFVYNSDPRQDFEQAFEYFRKLLEQYPESPWADNAAYEMFHYIDYHSTTTDDETPDGDDKEAFIAFSKYLDDYPDSDRSPEVMLRLAKVIIRGLGQRHIDQDKAEKAAEYLQIIAQKYPEFAKKEEGYQEAQNLLNARLWSNRWSLKIALNQTSFRIQDSIRVTVSLQNHSRSPQTLDTTFLNRWQEGLFLTLHPIRDIGCEDIWGDFPLIPENTTKDESITLPAGAAFTKNFVLAKSAVIKNYGSRKFDLTPGTTYIYNLEYRHPIKHWLWMSAHGTRFSIE